jgi:hypothetical protein
MFLKYSAPLLGFVLRTETAKNIRVNLGPWTFFLAMASLKIKVPSCVY